MEPVLPMGLKNSPATFQRIMTDVFRPVIGEFVHVFIDDILIYSPSPTQHYKHVRRVLEIVENNGFKVNLKKSEFSCDTIDYLGFTVSAKGVHPKLSQVRAVLNMPRPEDIHQLRSFTGMCNVFRWMIPHFADLTAPLDALKHKGVDVKRDWKEEHEQAFLKLKKVIANDVMVYRIDWNKPIHFGCDASDVGISAYVWQLDEDNNKRPVHFWSKTLSPTQRRYPTQERECLALVEGLKALDVYLAGREFNVYMDHKSLKYLMRARYHPKKLNNWAMEIQEYNIKDIVHIPGSTNSVADALSRLPLKEFLDVSAESDDVFPSVSFDIVNATEESNVVDDDYDYCVVHDIVRRY